jgi:hypothetical protein
MKVHPKQFIPAIKHIYENWIKGCKCVLCRGVDKREELEVK